MGSSKTAQIPVPLIDAIPAQGPLDPAATLENDAERLGANPPLLVLRHMIASPQQGKRLGSARVRPQDLDAAAHVAGLIGPIRGEREEDTAHPQDISLQEDVSARPRVLEPACAAASQLGPCA